jgi:hypothetical protein
MAGVPTHREGVHIVNLPDDDTPAQRTIFGGRGTRPAPAQVHATRGRDQRRKQRLNRGITKAL